MCDVGDSVVQVKQNCATIVLRYATEGAEELPRQSAIDMPKVQ